MQKLSMLTILLVSSAIVGKPQSISSASIIQNGQRVQLILFLNPQAVGYPPDSYTAGGMQSTTTTTHGCSTTSFSDTELIAQLKPGSKAGSIEWQELEQFICLEDTKYAEAIKSLEAIQQTLKNDAQSLAAHQQIHKQQAELGAAYATTTNALRQRQYGLENRLKEIALSIARRLGACGVMNTCHCTVIDSSYDITQECLNQLNYEYLTKMRSI